MHTRRLHAHQPTFSRGASWCSRFLCVTRVLQLATCTIQSLYWERVTLCTYC